MAKKRLAETQEELSAEVTSKAEKVHGLAEAIGKKLAEAEKAGAEGKVDESMKLMEEVEDFRKKKLQAEAGVPELHAGQFLPTTKASGVRGVLGLPRHPRQRSPFGRSFRRKTSPRIHKNSGEIGETFSKSISARSRLLIFK